MATLGLPRVRVAFLNAAAAVTRLDTTGIVALIMRDTAITAPAILTYPTLELALADKAWVVANATALKLAFKGDPRLVRVAALPTAGLMTAAYDLLDVMQFDVCCLVGGVADDMTSFVTWAKTSYDTRRKHALYVATATVTPDSPYLIWYATDSAVTSAGAYDAKTFLPRIAGLVAGLPLYQAPTYYVLDDVTDCTRLTRAQADTAIAAGKLVLYNDGVKVKVARGVNSLITVPGVLSYTDEWKKIKVVRILNRVESDVITVTEDNYIGKIPNTYINKLLLINDINAYLTQLEGVDVLVTGKNRVDIDVAAQRAYLYTIMDKAAVDEMDEQAIREADTRDKVFLTGTIRPIDSMEDVTINFAL